MKNLLYTIILVLFTCCSNNKNELVNIKDTNYFTDDSFENKTTLTHKVFNENFIGYPVRATLIDTFLLAVDMKSDSVIHFFSTNSQQHLGNYISRGNGPGELITCSNIAYSNNPRNFWAFDITSRRWIEYNIDKLINKQNQEVLNTIDFNKIKSDYNGINQPEWISDNKMVFNSLFKYNERLLIFDKDLNLKKEVHNENIQINNQYSDIILGDIFSTFISVKPDKSKVAIAGRYLDLIEIYDNNGNLLSLIKGPTKDFDFKFDITTSLNKGSMVKLPESRRAYIGMKTTNNHIYLLYSGKEQKDPNHYSYSNIIYTLDWNGQPLKKYELDAQISSFDINEEENTIYALHHDAYIVTYDM